MLSLSRFLVLPLLLASCQEEPPFIPHTELAPGHSLQSFTHADTTWQVITVDPTQAPPTIRLADSTGKALRHFSAFQEAATKTNESITWMMNAGMYHNDGNPVGLCIIEGQKISPINTTNGSGNFFLKPNGIFLLTDQGAQIIASPEWNSALAPRVHCATQSGPLLVRRGQFHPAIRPKSPNKHIRNGVGLRSDGQLCFVISTTPVTFHEMATFFRDELHCPDALYLDGVVSALHAPKAQLTADAKNLGPIIGLWQKDQ